MDATRATLLAALVIVLAAGAPAAEPVLGDPVLPVLPPPGYPARSPSANAAVPPVIVLPPQPLVMPTIPVPDRMPSGVQSTQYTLNAESAVSQPALGAQRMPIGQPVSQAQTAWLAAPVAEASPGRTGATAVQWTPANHAHLNRGTFVPPHSAPAPAWRWHGYGAATTSLAGPPAPYSPAPNSPPPLTPLPPPTPVTAQPIDPGPRTVVPTFVPIGAAPVEMLPPTPDVSPMPAPPGPMAPEFSTAAEPVWRATGERVATAQPTNPRIASTVWSAPGARPPNPMAAPSPATYAVTAEPAIPTTTRAMADAPPCTPAEAPRPTVQQVAFSMEQTARATAMARSQPPANGSTVQPARLASGAQAGTVQTTRGTVAAVAPSAAVPSLTSLRSCIERACGDRGRNLEVQLRAPGNLLVRVKVAKAADAEYLAHRISQIPELAPYRVIYEMRLAQ